MNIKEINDQFVSGRYQVAIINYTSYLNTIPAVSSFIGAIIQTGYRKLANQLIKKVEKFNDIQRHCQQLYENGFAILNVNIPNVTATQLTEINSILDCSKNIELIRWYRFDFIASGLLHNDVCSLRIPFCSLNGTPIKFSFNFESGTHYSLLLPSTCQEFTFGTYEESLCINGFGFSYSLTSLNQSQLAEQLCQLLKIREFGINGVDFNILNKNNKHTDNETMSDLYVKNYISLENCNDLDRNNICEVLRKSLKKSNQPFSEFVKGDANASQVKRKSILVASPDQLGDGIEFHIDSIFSYNNLYIINGWIVDFKKEVESVCFVDNNGNCQNDLFKSFVYFNRPDVTAYLIKSRRDDASQCAFVCVTPISPKFDRTTEVNKIVKISTISGNFFKFQVELIHLSHNIENLTSLMRAFTELAIDFSSCKNILKPIFQSINILNSNVQGLKISKNYYNQSEKKPTLSVIVPLYGSTRFELTQIPLIASLNKLDWEIIFAVDDLSIKKSVIDNVERLSQYYRVSISIVAPEINMGFSGINNLAVKQARADTVLFLNSDCFITNADSIMRGLQWLSSQSDAGAVGFRLLYADKSIQHDGMSAEQWADESKFFINAHPRQGVPGTLVPQQVAQDQSSLLTAACLMMPIRIFHEVEGFDTQYFMGDFEDSDICLKIKKLGKKLGIVRSNDIFHLERQSIREVDKLLQYRVTLTNSQIYTEKWGEILNAQLPPLTVIC